MAIEKIVTAAAVGALGAGAVILGASFGAFAGGLCGQILDWMPYVNHAIPEGIAYVGNAFSDADNTKEAVQYLQGNLDKLGAAVGFLGGYVKSSVTVNK